MLRTLSCGPARASTDALGDIVAAKDRLYTPARMAARECDPLVPRLGLDGDETLKAKIKA